MPLNSSAGQSEVIIEKTTSPDGTEKLAARVIGDISSKSRRELQSLFGKKKLAEATVQVAPTANVVPAAPAPAAAVPTTAPVTVETPAASPKKGLFAKARGLAALPFVKGYQGAKRVGNWAIGNGSPYNPATWAGKGVRAFFTGNGSGYNPITWPMKTFKTMKNDVAGTSYGAIFGAAIAAGIAPAALPFIAYSALGSGAGFALIRKFNKVSSSSEKA